jgi:hypothetical protein
MTKKLTQKLTSMINRTSQREALLTFLLSGVTFSAQDARNAGVRDPRRVINHLRSIGADIEAARTADRSGNVSTVYSLAAEKPVAKRSSKKSAR